MSLYYLAFIGLDDFVLNRVLSPFSKVQMKKNIFTDCMIIMWDSTNDRAGGITI